MDTKETAVSTTPAADDGAATRPQIPEDTLASVRAELVSGLLYNHNRMNANSSKLLETTAFLYAAIELLDEHGILAIKELDERKKDVAQRLMRLFFERGMGVVLMEPEGDKYNYEATAEVDCAGRMHVCKAVCCQLYFALSKQDVEEGIMRWELSDPYMSRHGPDAYCHHLDRTTHFCTIREHRPIPCRAYTCKGDDRIWKDFDNMVLQDDVFTKFREPVKGLQAAKLSKETRAKRGEPMIIDEVGGG